MNEELELTAAEFVLGTLPADERARVANQLSSNMELRAAVAGWQRRFAPLDETAPVERPPEALWRAIEYATSGVRSAAAVSDNSNVVELRRRLAFWRGAALVGGALAAGLAGFFVYDRLTLTETVGGRYVAVVDTGGREPALIAEVDTTTGLIRVRSLAAEIPAGQSLQLWHVAEGHAPRSLGLLQAGGQPQTIQDNVTAGALAGLIAVSVEPAGGSPTGGPTGTIVYSGELVPME